MRPFVEINLRFLLTLIFFMQRKRMQIWMISSAFATLQISFQARWTSSEKVSRSWKVNKISYEIFISYLLTTLCYSDYYQVTFVYSNSFWP